MCARVRCASQDVRAGNGVWVDVHVDPRQCGTASWPSHALAAGGKAGVRVQLQRGLQDLKGILPLYQQRRPCADAPSSFGCLLYCFGADRPWPAVCPRRERGVLEPSRILLFSMISLERYASLSSHVPAAVSYPSARPCFRLLPFCSACERGRFQ